MRDLFAISSTEPAAPRGGMRDLLSLTETTRPVQQEYKPDYWEDQLKPTLIEAGKELFELPKSLAEVGLSAGSSALGWLVGSGLAISEATKPESTRESVLMTAEDAAKRIAIEPKTRPAKYFMGKVGEGLEAISGPVGEAAALVGESWNSPLLEQTVKFAGELAAFELAGKGAKKVGKALLEPEAPLWYRKMTVRERGLIDPVIEGMKADIASGELTAAQIRELWNDKANRAELLKRYGGVGGEATGNVKPAGEPMRASGADAVKELPAGQGFQLRPTTEEVRDLLATMREEGPKALPAGQGFELYDKPQEIPKPPEVMALEKEIASNEAWIAKNAAYKGTPMHNGISAKLDGLRTKLSELTGEEIKPQAEVAAAPPEIVEPGATAPAAGALTPSPQAPSVPMKAQGPKTENAQGIIGRINAEGGINVYDGYNAPEMRQFPDMARVMKKDGRPPDEWAQILNDEGYNVGTGDDLIELIKSGKARQTYAPDKADALMEHDLLKAENEWAERQAAEAGEDAEWRNPLFNQRGSIDIGPMVEGIRNASAEVKKVASEVKKTADEYLGSISTRLGNIDPSLKYTLRNFEFQRGMKADDRARRVTPFMEKAAKMTPEDKAAFDIARKNGDPAELKRLVTKYGLGKEYHVLRVVLKDLYDQAKAVGYDIGYRPNYHPRVLKDPEGFLQYFYKQNDWPVLERAIREKETQLQRYLTDEEKAHLINNMLRGYPSGQISLSKPGQLKERQIKTIWPEINKFYMDSDAALLRYISDVTDAIEARKLFGKTAKGGKIADVKDTIGGYVLDLLQKGKIKPEQERPLREILDARFNEVGTRGVFGLYKNLSYLDTMGSPISAITQIGDLAWALYRNGVGPTVAATGKAIAGRSMLKKEDIGVGRIASEFADSSKSARAVDKVFRMIGLEKIDAIGKEALISSTYAKARSMAVKDPAKLATELKPIFDGETAQVVADLKAGKITENVKLYLFNTLADFQPIALSEMPAKYLTGGNGRIFYQLKTFTLKQFDVFRREAFQKIATEGQRAEGMKNLVKLSGALVAANATADVIKDLILGRPLDLPDKVVDNLMRLAGVSKFATWKAREEGPGTAAVLMAAPPFKAINAIYKDIMTAGDEKGLESVQSIPLVGKLYYWWFGKGAGKSEKKKASMGGGELKELKTLKGGLK